jgi:hypothetical protein
MTVDMSDGLIDYRHLLPIVGLMATYAYLSIRDGADLVRRIIQM